MKKNKNKKFNIKMFNGILLFVIIFLGVYYIAGTNDLTIKGFELQKLKLNSMEVEDNNNNLELKTMSLDSFNNLNKRIEELNMVVVGEVDYLTDAGSVVAKK